MSEARRRGDKTWCFSRDDILEEVRSRLGSVQVLSKPDDSAPAVRFSVRRGVSGAQQTFGIVASTTTPFCSNCDRARLTANGRFFNCLYAQGGVDLRGALRAGADDEEIFTLLRGTWEARDDRGAERRLAQQERTALYGKDDLRRGPASRDAHARRIAVWGEISPPALPWRRAGWGVLRFARVGFSRRCRSVRSFR